MNFVPFFKQPRASGPSRAPRSADPPSSREGLGYLRQVMEKVSEAEPRQAFSPTTWFPSSEPRAPSLSFLGPRPKNGHGQGGIHQVVIFYSCDVWLFLKRWVALWLSRQTKRTASHGWFCVFLRHTMVPFQTEGTTKKTHFDRTSCGVVSFGIWPTHCRATCKSVQGNLEKSSKQNKNENESEPCTAALKQRSQRDRF